MTWGSFGLSHTRGIHDAAGQSAKRDGLICNPALSRWLGLKACWLLPSILFCNSMIRSFHSQKLLGVPSSPLHNFHYPQRFPSIFPLIPSNCLPDSGNITIGCLAQGFKPDPVSFSWRKSNQIIDANLSEDFPSLAQPDGTFTTSSQVIVPVTDWNKYSHFYYWNLLSQIIKIPYEIPSTFLGMIPHIHDSCYPSACSENDPKVDVETIRPSFADIFINNSAKLTCKISNIHPGTDLSTLDVSWTQGPNKKPLDTKLGQPMDQENGLQYIEATATVCATEWNSEEIFTCKVDWPGVLPVPKEKTLQKSTTCSLSRPAVYILPPAAEEQELKETVTLTCLVKNFCPSDIFLQWLHNGQLVNATEYYISEPIPQSGSNSQFFLYSMLTVNEQQWSSGDTFTCMVGHEALPFNTTQKTVDKKTGKPSVVNVTLVLNDTDSSCY
uniref:Ig-like domain-containing protein n=1 Tax=Varanus komodoensis TaxID=61221 RepID=A0A8D2L3S2_VARKO